jgi:protein phosphatase
VGFEDEVNVDVYEMEVQTGDTFLICSDGLSGLVEEPEIQKLIQKNVYNGGTFKKTVDELIQQANNNGGDDNITSVVIQVTEAKGPCPTSFGGEA